MNRDSSRHKNGSAPGHGHNTSIITGIISDEEARANAQYGYYQSPMGRVSVRYLSDRRMSDKMRGMAIMYGANVA
jgi:hypothetical protein